MNGNIFSEINKLIEKNEIEKAQFKLSNLQNEYTKNPEYLYLRSKIFYLNKLYYLAIDTLFIALEFEENNKIYSLLSEIYKVLGNGDFSQKMLDKNKRNIAAKEAKDLMTGLYRKKK